MATLAGVMQQTRSAMQPLMSAGGVTTPASLRIASAAVNAHGPASSPMSRSLAAPQASSSTAGSSSSSATISANDFLTLLVTELQNQDPTAATDPNEYINQLVQVNSLEQLISINQNLSTVLGTSTSSSGTPAASTAAAAAQPGLAPSANSGAKSASIEAAARTPGSPAQPPAGIPLQTAGSTVPGAIGQFARSVSGRTAPGNLALPPADPAAQNVAHALDGRRHTTQTAGKLPGAQ